MSITSESKAVYSFDDGLDIPLVGAWSEKKYSLVGLYDELFSAGMKNIWTTVYIDLFAGSGKVRIEGTDKIPLGSPLLALNVPNRFDRYIFCERNPSRLQALKSRVEKEYPGAFQGTKRDTSSGGRSANITAIRKRFRLDSELSEQ